jgi:hypothetical protein
VRPWDPWSVGISQRGEGRVWHSGGSVMPMRSEEEAMGLGMALELVGGGPVRRDMKEGGARWPARHTSDGGGR